MFIRIIYTLFLGILIVLFVGFGIDTFYPEPKYPEMPLELEKMMNVQKEGVNVEQSKEWEEWRLTEKAYQEKIKVYNRNVSVIALLIALIVLVCALTFLKQIQMISDGILLGGVFILLYSMGRSFGSENSKFIFIVASVELVMAITLGYLIFVKPHQKELLASPAKTPGAAAEVKTTTVKPAAKKPAVRKSAAKKPAGRKKKSS